MRALRHGLQPDGCLSFGVLPAMSGAGGFRPAQLPPVRGSGENADVPTTRDNGGTRMTIVWILIVIILILLAIYLFRRVV